MLKKGVRRISLLCLIILSIGLCVPVLFLQVKDVCAQVVVSHIYVDLPADSSPSIAWGNLTAGESVEAIVTLTNVGSTTITNVDFSTSGWSGTSQQYLTLSWNYANQTWAPYQSRDVTFTLFVHGGAAVQVFSFNIIITSTSDDPSSSPSPSSPPQYGGPVGLAGPLYSLPSASPTPQQSFALSPSAKVSASAGSDFSLDVWLLVAVAGVVAWISVRNNVGGRR